MKLAHPLLVIVGLTTSCGGQKPPPPPAPPAPPSSVTPAASSGAPAASAKTDEDEAQDEVAPSAKAAAAAATPSAPSAPGAAVKLEPLLEKGATAGFPKKAATDKECYRTVNLTGKHDKDYDSLVAACGAATGMKEFTKKVTGKLDAKHPRDTYVVKMLGGFCYRFYAVGDASMGNIDIRVQRPTGALVSMDQSKQAIAILDPDEPWCKKHDREFHFIVETTGAAGGGYTFGVWARPSK